MPKETSENILKFKFCNKCKIEKPTSEFYKKGTGFNYRCILCVKQYNQDNKKEIAAKKKQYYEDNKEKFVIKAKKYYEANKGEIIIRTKTYYENNKEEMDIQKKQYREDNKEKKAISDKQYRENNKEKIKKYKKEYQKNRRKNDPIFKLRQNISKNINRALKQSGSSKIGKSCLKYLPYTINELKIHLQNQFKDWMNWDNWKIYNLKTWDDNNEATWTWNLDHIIPQSDLPYSKMTDENFKKTWALSNLRPYSAKQNILDGSTRIRHKKKE